jgi:hypothetical protein
VPKGEGVGRVRTTLRAAGVECERSAGNESARTDAIGEMGRHSHTGFKQRERSLVERQGRAPPQPPPLSPEPPLASSSRHDLTTHAALRRTNTSPSPLTLHDHHTHTRPQPAVDQPQAASSLSRCPSADDEQMHQQQVLHPSSHWFCESDRGCCSGSASVSGSGLCCLVSLISLITHTHTHTQTHTHTHTSFPSTEVSIALCTAAGTTVAQSRS